MKVKLLGQHNGRQSFYFLCPGCAQLDEPGSKLYAIHTFNDTWTFNGDGDKPTVSPSLLVTDGRPAYRCHSFIEGGQIRFLSDCSHSLAGQTVELPEVE